MLMQDLLNTLKEKFLKHGMELFSFFRVEDYNRQVETKHHLPQFEKSFGILIGNTRTIWPLFQNHLKVFPRWKESENPFDEFIESSVSQCLDAFPLSHEIRFAHKPQPFHIAFQKLAQIAGVAYLSQSHLSIHPKWGPWFSLRAAIVMEGSHELPPSSLENNPCSFCEQKCGTAFEKAYTKMQSSSLPVEENWRDWLNVRDACPLGREYRFSDQQVEYHYTKNKAMLET